jgi:hypothetical protein
MVGPPYAFSLGDATSERATLAAELISAGESVDLYGITVTLKDPSLEVAIFVDSSLQPGELPALRQRAVDILSEVACRWPVIRAVIESTDRRFVLLHNYGMGAVMIGYWNEETFIRDSHAPNSIRTPF